MIEGVVQKELRVNLDERGYLMEIIRRDEDLFLGFGQAYVSAVFPGIVKAWHAHAKQTDNMCCVRGNVKFGLYDDRPESATRGETMSLVIGERRPVLLQIPIGVWHGFMAVAGEMALVLNVPTEAYNAQQPDELRRDPFDPEIPFVWQVEGG